MNTIFIALCRPFEMDKPVDIIDYNWQVDKILKNSHPYDTTKNKTKKDKIKKDKRQKFDEKPI